MSLSFCLFPAFGAACWQRRGIVSAPSAPRLLRPAPLGVQAGRVPSAGRRRPGVTMVPAVVVPVSSRHSGCSLPLAKIAQTVVTAKCFLETILPGHGCRLPSAGQWAGVAAVALQSGPFCVAFWVVSRCVSGRFVIRWAAGCCAACRVCGFGAWLAAGFTALPGLRRWGLRPCRQGLCPLPSVAPGRGGAASRPFCRQARPLPSGFAFLALSLLKMAKHLADVIKCCIFARHRRH